MPELPAPWGWEFHLYYELDIYMIVITDILKGVSDEGAKNAIIHILRKMKEKNDYYIISINGNFQNDFVDFKLSINRMLFKIGFYKKLRKIQDEKILYIPEASITFFSFIRGRLIQVFTGKRVAILSTQPRKYGNLLIKLIKFIRPDFVISQTIRTASYLNSLGIKNEVLSLGVDSLKFQKVSLQNKKRLREKFGIKDSKTVILHVGHIRKTRNLDWLIKVKLQFPEVEIIIVGSTSFPNDEDLYDILVKNNIIVIKEYLPNIEEVYNVSDYYIFPVIDNEGAIETPLSVLEAMACNLQVITTRFGSLIDLFEPDDYFHFVDSVDEVFNILKRGKRNKCNNRLKVKPFTWDVVSNRLYEILEQQI